MRRLAERLGYRVVAARSLGEAKRLLARIARPCLVLLDTLMKEGLEAMTHLGAQYPLATIPVRLSGTNVRRISKRSVHLDLLQEALEQHCGPVRRRRGARRQRVAELRRSDPSGCRGR